MYSQLIDQETFARVISAAPSDIPGEYDAIAKQIVTVLYDIVADAAGGEKSFFFITVSELAEILSADYELTPALIGRVVGELGLLKKRRRNGYTIYFSAEQINILLEAFELAVQP